MKRSKFSEAQVALILRQVDEGATVGEVCRKAGISEATFYVWRKKYAGLMPSEMKRLRQLEDENARLKRIVAQCTDIAHRCGHCEVEMWLALSGVRVLVSVVLTKRGGRDARRSGRCGVLRARRSAGSCPRCGPCWRTRGGRMCG